MSKNPNFTIAVVGHENISISLPDGFKYITREVDHELRQSMDLSYKFHSSGLAWSEYAAMFERYDLLNEEVSSVGLYHYRCILNLNGSILNTLPIFLRERTLSGQTSKIQEEEGKILVGVPIVFPETLLKNFEYAHPNFMNILEFACHIYDELNGNKFGFAFDYLATNTQLISRNIFIAPKEFSDRWIMLAFEIARKLDAAFPQPTPDRWGGFVLERLFSIYVVQEIDRGKYKVEFYPHLYFASTRMWIKIAFANFRTGLGKLIRNATKSF